MRRLAGLLGVVALFAAVATSAAALQVDDWNPAPAADIDATVHDVLRQPAYGGEQRGLSGLLLDNPITRFLVDLWDRFVDWLNSLFPDSRPSPTPDAAPRDLGRASFGLALLLGIALVAGVVASRLARARTRQELRDFSSDPTSDLNSEELVSAADAAERAGDHEGSVRLRFKAGLLTLDRRGMIDYDESTALGTVRRTLEEPDFDAVANGFERVTYSDYEAQQEDSEFARSGWQRLLDRVRGRDDQ